MPFANQHPLYAVWAQMRGRVMNPRNPAFHNYGGRGISICPRWDSFAAFVEDMGPRPGPEWTLDRINNDGNYESSNCRWATKKEQARNQGKTLTVEIEGQRYIARDLADISGLNHRTIVDRASKGLTYAEVIDAAHIKRSIAPKVQESAWAKKRSQTECKRGHVYSPETVLVMSDGRRQCRVCRAMTKTAWREKRRAAGLPYA